MRNPILAASLAAFLIVGGVAPASADAAASCSVTTAGTLAFGTYSVYGASNLTTNTTATVSCSGVGNDSLKFQLSAGNGTFAQRLMKSGTAALNYQVYTSSAATTVFGDGTGSTGTLSASVSNGSTSGSVTFYGVIPSGQDVASGSYTDTLTLTVAY